MSDPSRSRRRFIPARMATIVAMVIAFAVTPVPGASAEPVPAPQPPAVAAAADQPNDESTKMPQTMRDDLVGDFLGLGYDQRMRAEDTSLNIYDSESRGGALLQKTDMDLAPAPTDGALWESGGLSSRIPMFSGYSSLRNRTGAGIPAQRRDQYHLNSIYLAATDGYIYISGVKGSTIHAGGSGNDPYRVLVYRVAYNGTCAEESCASKVASLPTDIEVTDPNTLWQEHRSIGITSLAAADGWGLQTGMVAVGLTDGGVHLFNSDLVQKDVWLGCNIASDPASQTAITSLTWAVTENAQPRLIVGVMSTSVQAYVLSMLSSETVTTTMPLTAMTGSVGLERFPLSAAIGYRPNNQRRMAAIGMSNATLVLADVDHDFTVLFTTPIAEAGIAVNAVPRLDTTGGTDWAVSTQTGSDVLNGVGQMFRDSGTSLVAQPLSVDDQGIKQNTTDRSSFRSWFPGYRQGRFRLINGFNEPVKVTLDVDYRSGSGCWLLYDGDSDAFPADGLILDGSDGPSDYFTLGAFTAGINEAGCSQDPGTDGSASWRGYLTVSPINHPADARTMNIYLNNPASDPWTVDTSDAVTGSIGLITIADAPDLPAMPYGYTTFYLPGPSGGWRGPAPTLSINRLSGPVRNVTNGVYRIDVGQLSWMFQQGNDGGAAGPEHRQTRAGARPHRLELDRHRGVPADRQTHIVDRPDGRARRQ